MKKIINKSNILFFIIGFSLITTYVLASTFSSAIVSYDNTNSSLTSTNVKMALDELVLSCFTPHLKGAVLDSTAGVDFSKTSVDNGTNGLYILSGTENDTYPIYYYRGAVDNNNLYFAGFCWKIVRTTDTGGLRLIYNGKSKNGKCDHGNYTDSGRSSSTSTLTMTSGAVYYYGTEYTFNSSTKKYTLSGTISSGIWSSDKINLYTCKSTYSSGICTTLYYLNSYISNTQATVYEYTSTSNTQIGTSAFNSSHDSPADVGYMYGTKYTYTSKSLSSDTTAYVFGNTATYSGGTYTLSNTLTTTGTWSSDYNTLNNNHYTCFTTGTTCTSLYYVYYTTSGTAYYITLTGGTMVEGALSAMLDNNTTDSTIKTAVDNWYSQNILGTSYESLIDKNEIFCNDRSIYQLNGWNPNGGSTVGTSSFLYFGAYGRLDYTPAQFTPTVTCPRDIDKFTATTASTGNKALTYPVGLLTADEIVMAGARYNTSNSKYYLHTGEQWWADSPYGFHASSTHQLSESSLTTLVPLNGHYTIGARPVISLANGYEISTGDGTGSNPYVVGEIINSFPDMVNDTPVLDNIASTYVTSSTGINFNAISSDTNGKGLYILNGTENNEYPIYYYRGAVDNNLIYAGFCWKMVRTTDTGGLKLIYNGTPTSGSCNTSGTATTLSSTSKFNASTNRNAYVGYMYGSTASGVTYDQTHANTTDSTIKTAIDNWYSSNLSSYTSELDDTIFCNDRSLQSGTGIYTTATYYKAYNRLYTNKSPSLDCPNADNDLFTTTSATTGNKKLSNPVGLITADEVALAGGKNATNNTSYYLYNGQNNYTASPYRFYNSVSYMYYVNTNGSLANGSVATAYRVRPVIVLKNGFNISSGSGTTSSPYIVS